MTRPGDDEFYDACDRRGVMVWQTYDYYFDPVAAYFGCKKASAAVHIQWNPVYDTIEVVNYNGKDRKGLTAKAQTLIWMDRCSGKKKLRLIAEKILQQIVFSFLLHRVFLRYIL